MSDFNSSLPVRTENNGDIVAKIGDGTTPSQQLGVDSSGRIVVKLDDGSGNVISSQVNGAQRALDVGVNVAGVQVDPRAIRALTSADVVSVVQSTSPWITKDQADGSATGGTAGSFSMLAGGIYNTSAPVLTNGQQAGLQVDASGRVLVATSNSDDHNFGTVGATTLRTAAEIGNATGAASFNVGATGAQTLRVEANQGTANATPWNENIAQIAGAVPSATNALPAQLSTAGAFISTANPLPVSISSSIPGTAIHNYSTATVAAAGTSNHDYTVSATKTLNLARVYASASGKLKIEVQYETAAASGVFNTKFVGFNSTAAPNIDITIVSAFAQVTGAKIRVIRTNLDKASEDVYSTIEGTEV